MSVDIRKGETFALVGESGSGKSTVARMAVGLLPVTSGTVTIDGVSMTDVKDSAARQALRKRIQMIFQDPMPASTRAGRSRASLPSRSMPSGWQKQNRAKWRPVRVKICVKKNDKGEAVEARVGEFAHARGPAPR